MTLDELRVRRDEIFEVCARHGGSNIRVFGSIARGDAGPASDVDLLVDLASGRSLLDRCHMILDLESLLGCHVDALSSRGIPPYLRGAILGEAVPL